MKVDVEFIILLRRLFLAAANECQTMIEEKEANQARWAEMAEQARRQSAWDKASKMGYP